MILQRIPKTKCRRVDDFVLGGGLGHGPWPRLARLVLRDTTGRQTAHTSPGFVQTCWTTTHLCAAFSCPGKAPKCTYTHRDDPLYDEDVVELFIAPDASEPRNYFELEFNAHGTIFDAVVVHPDLAGNGRPAVATEWTCDGLKVDARIHSGRWEVEIAIPFSGLGMPPPHIGDTWRFNAYRIDYGPPDHYLAWSPTLRPEPSFHVPGRFGILEFGK